MKRTIGMVIGIGLVLLLGCAAPAPTAEPTPTAAPITTVEELLAIWQRGATPYYLQFNGDGTYRVASSPEELEDDPWFEGQFWFEAEQLFLKDTAGSVSMHDCLGLPAGSYEVQGAVKGYLTFVAIDDPCEDRREGFPYLPFRWVSP